MPRTSVATTPITRAGTIPAASAPTVSGDIIDTGATVFLLVENTDAAPITVTVTTQATFDGLAVTNLAVTVAPATKRAIGPISSVTFGLPKTDPNAGRAYVDYTGVVANIKRSVLSY